MAQAQDSNYWHELAERVAMPASLIIGGETVAAASGATFTTLDPATSRPLGEVARGAAEDIDRAVHAARRAFDGGSWSRAAPAVRKRVLCRLADLLLENLDEFAVLDSLDGGRLISSTSASDVPGSANILRWYGELIDKRYDEIAPTSPQNLGAVTREPLGVVGVVVPWNFPLLMAIWKLAPALAAGNSVVLKPAEQSPLSAIRFGALALEAGLPDGVLNVVSGLGPEAGRALGEHQDVDCVAFTGSTPVGKLFLQYSAASNLKQIWPECGGKSANVVFADSDHLDIAAQQTVRSMFSSAGQVCSANTRILVQRSIADEFLQQVLAHTAQLHPGDPLDPQTNFGPVISERQMDRVLGYIAAGRETSRLVAGGGRVATHPDGYYIEPTIFADVAPDTVIAQEEIFGPVLAISTFTDEAEALRIANGTRYGLAASLWTSNLERAVRVSRSLVAGTVSINSIDAVDVTVPFGGMKESGYGRDLSPHALDKYTSLKTTWLELHDN